MAAADRPDADKTRDAARKPAEVLEFAGVKAGEKVGELLPGGGYFTRLLSAAVGPQGKVYAGVSASAEEKSKAALEKGNVHVVVMNPPALNFPEPVDLIFTAQNYHDFHLASRNLDVAQVNKHLYDALKPGGVLLVIDHAAAAGAPIEVADTLHRIDKFVGESNAIRNPDDPKTGKVFDPAIRGKTDQFIYKFQKPN